MKYKVGTRGSLLATIQTKFVINQLQAAFPNDEFEIVEIVTKGDKIVDKPIHEINDKGLFVNAIEEKLVSKEIDFAVHSMKDLPSKINEKCCLAKAMLREDPRDTLILKNAKSLDELKTGATIATGSLRRILQLKLIRPDIKTKNIRGNINTRITKLDDDKEVDGIILAQAGLNRIGACDSKHTFIPFDEEEMIPAPTQGTLAIELYKDNNELLDKINSLSDEITNNETICERKFLELMGGDCHAPIGAYCLYNGESYHLITIFSNPENSVVAKTDNKGKDSIELAETAAKQTKMIMEGKDHE